MRGGGKRGRRQGNGGHADRPQVQQRGAGDYASSQIHNDSVGSDGEAGLADEE